MATAAITPRAARDSRTGSERRRSTFCGWKAFVKFVTLRVYLLTAAMKRSMDSPGSVDPAHRDGPPKVALITGASRGLGKVLAAFLAKQGFALILTARDAAELRKAADEIQQVGSPLVWVPGDVSEKAHRERLVRAAQERGRLDVLVNNASELGESPLPPLVRATRNGLVRVFDVNAFAPLALIQDTLPLLIRSRGLVVNITSDAAVGGYSGWGVYGASKAALDLISKTLAQELKDDGVGVVSVDPGDMRTTMHQDAFPGEDISDRPLPDVTLPFWAWLLSQTPMAVSGGRYQAQAAVWEARA